MRVNIALLVLSLCLLVYGNAAAEPGPIVAVEGGEIQGSFEADGEIAVFKGIPYAAPPVGELRWKPPHPVKPWEGDPRRHSIRSPSAHRAMTTRTTSSGG